MEKVPFTGYGIDSGLFVSFSYVSSTGMESRQRTTSYASIQPRLKRVSSFHFPLVVTGAICALSLCDRSYPRKGAFAYLDDIANEFLNQYATKVSYSVFGSIEYRFQLAEHYGMWMLLEVNSQLTDSFAGRRCQ